MTPVPFKWTQKDGFVAIAGTALLDGDTLVLRLARSLMELVPIGTREVRIPVDEIAHIGVERTMFSCRLVVRVFSPEVLAGVPTAPTDEVTMPIARKHADAAEALAREARLRNL